MYAIRSYYVYRWKCRAPDCGTTECCDHCGRRPECGFLIPLTCEIPAIRFASKYPCDSCYRLTVKARLLVCGELEEKNFMDKQKLPGILALEDGSVFRGEGFGACKTVVGEAVFNTSMTGYQEILTDPSYYGQVVTMTASQIGNYGIV